jgi:hypothetical protein
LNVGTVASAAQWSVKRDRSSYGPILGFLGQYYEASPTSRVHIAREDRPMDREPTTPTLANDAASAASKTLTASVPSIVQVRTPLTGSVLVLIQFDVCEEIRLDELRRIIGARQQQLPLKNTAPSYVRYMRTPVVEMLDPVVLDSGERLEGQIKYFDYGVVSLVFELPFAGGWDDLVQLSCRWTSDPNFESVATRIARQRLERAAPALVKPYHAKPDSGPWLQEDYYIFHVREIEGSPSAKDLLAAQGDKIAQIVRGETAQLSDSERQEILQSRISYYPNDLAVIGWNAAFVYDTATGAETAIQLLQYANSQLLEFRHYDEFLTRELENVYDFLETGGTGWWSRWRTARAASKLHTVLLDVNELTERADNAIKFLSDMFSARLYKLCAAKVGVPDYKDLVKEKLQTAEDLYRFMVEQFNQSRAFVLELMVVVILIIELIYFFKGHPM